MKAARNYSNLAPKALLAALLGFASLGATAQGFSVSPSNTVSGTVEQFDYLALEIDLTNESATDMRFEYELISSTVPASWSAVMCDYTNCFPYLSPSRVMEPVAPGDHGFIKLTINPDAVLGMAEVVYDVWEYGDVATKQTLTFQINTVVGVKDAVEAAKLQVFPNPATDRVRVALPQGAQGNGTVSILSLTGQILLHQDLAAVSVTGVDVSSLPVGAYLITCATEHQTLTQKLLITE
jgi:hypothetical protein